MKSVDNITRIEAIVARCAFPHLDLKVLRDGQRPYLQIHCTLPDSYTGLPKALTGRKWMLSQHMTKGGIVQTALKAALAFVEHEAREAFTYDGYSIFDPHYDVDKLVELRKQPDCLDDDRVDGLGKAAA